MTPCERGVDRRHDVGLEHHAGRFDVVVDLFGTRRADDGRRHVVVLQHPGHGELGHRQAEVVGDRLQVLHRRQRVVVEEALDEDAALVVGRPGLGRRRLAGLVLAGQDALRDRRPDDLGDAELAAGRHDLTLDHAPQHRVLRLARDELDAEVDGERVAGAELVGRPLRHADVERLAAPDDVGEGLHRLFERCLVVVPVGLVQVDVVDASRRRLPSIDSRMCLRDSPRSFTPEPVGQ